MNRRAVALKRRPGLNEKFSRAVCALLAVIAVLGSGPATAIEAPDDRVPTSEQPPPSTDVPIEPDIVRPPITANDFLPEDRDLTSCIGVLERPGCGSENRGGWRQTLILVAIFGGLAVVFGNVIRGVRKRNG